MPQVILVDKNDQVIGQAEKLAAHQQAKLHRAFSVFIYRIHNDEIEILLQQRHPDKYHSGGLWTNTCCSHPAPGEETLPAAQKRLKEEMGIFAELKHVGEFCYQAKVGNDLIEYEYDHVFIGTTQDQIQVDPNEIINVRWMKLSDLQLDLKIHPEKYTAWFGQALEFVIGELK
jgi:diphosphomevalonate decarboxylase